MSISVAVGTNAGYKYVNLMRITLAIFSLRPHSGLSNDCIELADVLHDKGHDVCLVCGDIRQNLDRAYAIKNLGISSHNNAKFNMQSSIGILDAHRFWQNDVLIGFNKMPNLDFYYMGDFCWADKVTEYSKFTVENSERHQTQLKFEQAVFNETGPHIFSQSLREKERFKLHYGTKEKRFINLKPRANKKNISSIDSAEREQIRKQHHTHQHDMIWLAVGNAFTTKGLIHSIKALANQRLSHCQLWVVGADNTDKYVKIAQTLHVIDRVHFLGARNDVGSLMNSADILVHPARRELSGTVIIEAIANGLPVICSEYCGNAHYVEIAKAGLIVNSPVEQISYEQALIKLSLNHNVRASIAKNAHDYYQTNKTEWSLFFEEIVRAIESVKG